MQNDPKLVFPKVTCDWNVEKTSESGAPWPSVCEHAVSMYSCHPEVFPLTGCALCLATRATAPCGTVAACSRCHYVLRCSAPTSTSSDHTSIISGHQSPVSSVASTLSVYIHVHFMWWFREASKYFPVEEKKIFALTYLETDVSLAQIEIDDVARTVRLRGWENVH